MGDKTATAIASALQNERCMIQSLNLSNNKIGGQGGKMIGYAIRSNVELKELILSGNPLGDLGVSSFAESMEGVEAPEGGDEKKDAYEDSGKSKKERKEVRIEEERGGEEGGSPPVQLTKLSSAPPSMPMRARVNMPRSRARTVG